MLRPGRFALLLITAYLLVFAYNAYSRLPRFPVTRSAADLVLQQADLPAPFEPLAAESGEISANPYADYTEHFRSGYRAVFTGTANSQWAQTRLISSSFVLDQKGAEQVYLSYEKSSRNRGETPSLPLLGQESLFYISRHEPSAPVVIVGAVRVKNALITLTVMTDQEIDPALVHGWAQILVERVAP